MKTLQLICIPILLLSSLNSTGQDYRPMLSVTDQWNVTQSMFVTSTIIWKIDGDTILNGKEYHLIGGTEYYDGNYYPQYTIAMREDSIEKKVFLGSLGYGVTPGVDSVERLKFDFSKGEGDSVLVFSDWDNSQKTFYVDSIRSDTAGRRVFYVHFMHDNWEIPNIWLEGIGSVYGPYMNSNTVTWGLVCAFKTGIRTYHDSFYPESDSCLIYINGINEIHSEPIRIYPNPASTVISWDNFPGPDSYQIDIFDYTGKTIIKSQSFEPNLNIANLPSGFYIIRISNGKQAGFTKLMKE